MQDGRVQHHSQVSSVLERFWGMLRRQISKDGLNSKDKTKKQKDILEVTWCFSLVLEDMFLLPSGWLESLTQMRDIVPHAGQAQRGWVSQEGLYLMAHKIRYKELRMMKAWWIRQGVIIWTETTKIDTYTKYACRESHNKGNVYHYQ